MKTKGNRNRKLLAPILGLAVLAPVVHPYSASAAGGEKVKNVEFIGMSAPQSAADLGRLYTNASVKVTYADGSVRIYPLTYKTLFKSTDSVNGTPAGLAVDVNGKPILDTSVADNPTPFISDDPDSNSLFQVEGAPATGKGGNPLTLITHYEYITSNNAGKSAYGVVPASMSQTVIDQNKTSGELTAVDLKKVDFSGVGGLWIPCNGSLTPWNTHLGSEEYDPDARAYEGDPAQTYVGGFVKSYYQDGSKTGNPYAFGWIPEVTVDSKNQASVEKHYSMGRFSHELGKVAPDGRTVFFGDDGANTMLFLYVADKAQDLSAGTLYAAKWVQTSADNGGSADLEWIRLGHATDAEIKAYVDQGLKFSDLFETASQDTAGFTKIKTYPSGKVEWLKVKPGMETAAAFLESRRYGAILGATSEFNKMEGVTVNSKDKKVYIAMSYLEKTMEKDSKGADPTDHIQVKKIKAGVTYELDLKGGAKDTSGQKIDSSYVAVNMKGLIWGEDLAQPDWKGNTAADDKVANPDNLAYSEELRTLFIGEDSGMHATNYMWAYNIDTKKLTRILSLPAGAESTGLQVVGNLNGFSYIMSNLQHPGDEMIIPEPLKSEVETYINANFMNKKAGSVGYLSGVPTMEQMAEWKDTDKSFTLLRVTAEAAGAAVSWNDVGRSVTVTKGTDTLTVKIGESTATINGKSVQLPSEVRLEEERTIIPTETLNHFLSSK